MENGKKARFKVVGTTTSGSRFFFICEEVETGKNVNLMRSPKIKDKKLNVGQEYFFIVNENWINDIQELEPQEVNKEEKVAQKKEEVEKKVPEHYNKDLIILYQNQTMPTIELAKSQYDTITENAVIEIRDKLVKDILSRCKE